MPMTARAAALLIAVLPLAHAGAQDSTRVAAADSVDVRRGDTLWGLASQRLGDPNRWPAIHEVNMDRVANPHWIYPGQRLRMPGALASATPAPAAESPAAPPSTGPLAWTVKTPEPAAEAPTSARSAWPARDSASRLVALAAAPYVGSRAALASAGSVVSAMDLARDGSRSEKRRLLLNDRVAVTLPRGWTEGRFVLVREGPEVAGQPVFVPTALVNVAERSGDFAVGRVVRLFGAAELGDRVLPANGLQIPAQGAARAATRDTRVLWIAGSAELPSLGTAVILGAGAADRVTQDDEFELRSADQSIAGRRLGGSLVAVVRVMRVGERTSTAIVVSQREPSIAVGMLARPMTERTPRP